MTRTGVVGWALAAPALAVIAVFFAVPVVMGLALSLTDFDLYALADLGNLRFVGFGNYAELFGTPLFWRALANTFYFVIVGQNSTKEGSYGTGSNAERREAVGVGTCDRPLDLTGACP